MAEPDYRGYAAAGTAALQQWYRPWRGLWATTGWWNSANALTAVIGYTQWTGDRSYAGVIETTFRAGRRWHRGPESFINRYYDDNAWWALAWVAAYDLTRDRRYLEAARSIFDRNTAGWDDTCRGGLWWNEDRKYKNAITNELFLTLAARLHQRVPGAGDHYRSWALREWDWLRASGMIGTSGLVNDGLTAACANNGGTTWTYNQGVILGGLAALHEISGDRGYLEQGESIADATLARPACPASSLSPAKPRQLPRGTIRSSRASSSATSATSAGRALAPATARSSSPMPARSGTTPGMRIISSGSAGVAPSTGQMPAGRVRPWTRSTPRSPSPRTRPEGPAMRWLRRFGPPGRLWPRRDSAGPDSVAP